SLVRLDRPPKAMACPQSSEGPLQCELADTRREYAAAAVVAGASRNLSETAGGDAGSSLGDAVAVDGARTHARIHQVGAIEQVEEIGAELQLDAILVHHDFLIQAAIIGEHAGTTERPLADVSP